MDFFALVGLGACFYFLVYGICLWFFDCDLQLAFCGKFGKKLSKLKGKVVWITGCTTPLGRMLALKVAKHNGKLVLSSNSPKDLNKIKTSCLKINPFMRSRDILVLEFVMGPKNSHELALGEILKHYGTLDILILNEDKWERCAWENTPQTVDRLLFQSNLFRVVSFCRSVVKYFNSKRKGKLTIISSIAGLIGVPFSGSYTGTKHALQGYIDSLRFEKIGGNLQVTLLCLGSSELLQEKHVGDEDKFLDLEVSMKKKMTVERCAHLCLTAIVNDLDECWMAVFPILPLIYGIKYFPNITKSLLRYLKPKEHPRWNS